MKRVALGIMMLAIIALLASCGTGTPTASQPNGNNTGSSGNNANTGQTQPTDEKPTKATETITVYYSDHQLTELLTEKREITYQDSAEKYKAAVRILEHPEDPSHAPLWHNFKYHSITIADGRVIIDADSSNQYNLGSTGEMMAIKAMTQTLFQFPEVKEVLFLVDGQTAESLMGHVDISQPFGLED